MKILQRISVPTGDICIVEGEKGKLEMLSIGDYGKDVNLKANFMGLNREPSPVRHTALLPLEEKWVVTISTQYGCDSGCTFCDVPKVGRGINATFNDLTQQVLTAIKLHPEVETTKRLNIHYARMGEPTWNPNVLDATKWFKDHIDPEYKIHPVVSSMMPCRNDWLKTFIHQWMRIKNRLLHGEAGLQLSINSTDEAARTKMFRGSQTSLEGIARIMEGIIPNGRKITLNFALGDWDIDGDVLLKYFNPDWFLCKLTPLHQTRSVDSKEMMPEGDWTEYTPYASTETSLRKAGYDVIVFIASKEEDESRITCGNALLADKKDQYTDLIVPPGCKVDPRPIFPAGHPQNPLPFNGRRYPLG
jgi:23S rRNA (adenine2503-C2)-methyltransferase